MDLAGLRPNAGPNDLMHLSKSRTHTHTYQKLWGGGALVHIGTIGGSKSRAHENSSS